MKNQQAGNQKRSAASMEIWNSRKEEIVWLYNSQGWSQSKVAEYFGVSQAMLHKVLRQLGIAARSKGNLGAKNGRYKNGLQSRMYRQLVEKDKCDICSATERLAIHHKNGDHFDDRLSNLQVLCWSCHNKETKKTYWEKIKCQKQDFPISRDASGKFTSERSSS